MSTNMERMGPQPTTGGGSDHPTYREAEARLWAHYGVDPKERLVDTRSPAARLRVLEAGGTGDPVIFVHGTGGTGPYWGALVRELGDFRCLLLDRPGWGFSTGIDYAGHDYGALTGELMAQVLDGLGIERAHVVGASIGDVWALRLAQRHPSRVASVTLLGGGPLLQDLPVPKFIRIVRSPLGRIMVGLPEKRGRLESILRTIGHGPSLDQGRIPDEYLRWHLALSNEGHPLRSERAMVRAIVTRRGFVPTLTFDRAELTSIPHPTLMVFATGDPNGTVELWRTFTGLLPSGELHVMEGGHLPWLDDPKRVAGALAGHFRANPA
jgi:pimeloyl-ACP methyl ester carboxylesterase